MHNNSEDALPSKCARIPSSSSRSCNSTTARLAGKDSESKITQVEQKLLIIYLITTSYATSQPCDNYPLYIYEQDLRKENAALLKELSKIKQVYKNKVRMLCGSLVRCSQPLKKVGVWSSQWYSSNSRTGLAQLSRQTPGVDATPDQQLPNVVYHL